ncbi:50S ribosomal protein L17 [Candidatus Gottesmanbacteria bacterium]|nr:50S ribosomal protein L17 [Candidatus Gottesmanbacteria bacterium]
MRHSVFGRKFSRTKNERKHLFAGLVRALLLHGSIKTTVAKAKAVQPIVEKLVTKAKAGRDVDRRIILRLLDDTEVVDQLLSDAKTRFGNRTSGFTRIVRLGKRLGDAAEVALLQFVDERVEAGVIAPKVVSLRAQPLAGRGNPKRSKRLLRRPAKRDSSQ